MRKRLGGWSRILAIVFLTLASAAAPARARDAQNVQDLTDQVAAGAAIGDYAGEDMMIPMRDGVKLHVQVWRPKNSTGPLPGLADPAFAGPSA